MEPLLPTRNMLGLLLRLGADPNQLWHGNTPWEHALSFFHKQNSSFLPENLVLESCSIFTMMLRYGASIYTTCTDTHGVYNVEHPCGYSHSVRAVINDFFLEAPSKAAKLYRLRDERASVQDSTSSSRESGRFDPENLSKRRACEPFEEELRKRGGHHGRSYE